MDKVNPMADASRGLLYTRYVASPALNAAASISLLIDTHLKGINRKESKKYA
jgi:hypothetical protein